MGFGKTLFSPLFSPSRLLVPPISNSPPRGLFLLHTRVYLKDDACGLTCPPLLTSLLFPSSLISGGSFFHSLPCEWVEEAHVSSSPVEQQWVGPWKEEERTSWYLQGRERLPFTRERGHCRRHRYPPPSSFPTPPRALHPFFFSRHETGRRSQLSHLGLRPPTN